jgi:hypothetical protein
MSIKTLSKIINSNTEYRPTNKINNTWKSVDNYHVMKKKLQYNITEDLIKLIDNFTKEYIEYKKISGKKENIMTKYDDKIALIYLIENIRNNKICVGYTTNPLFTFIKFNLHRLNMKETSIFDNFKYNKLSEFKIELLEYINYNTKRDINKRKQYWNDKLINDSSSYTYSTPTSSTPTSSTTSSAILSEDKYEPDTKINAKFYNKRIDVFFNVFTPFITEFDKVIGYIYKLESKKNKRVFIGGNTDKITLDEALDKLNTNEKIVHDLKKYKKKNFKIQILEKYYAKSQIDFMLRIDYYKVVYDSVDGGYNMDYCIDESKLLFAEKLNTKVKNRIEVIFFLKINRHLIDNKLKDSTDYTDVENFVYQIKNIRNKKKYISFSNDNNSDLKQKILGLYDNAIDGNVKHSKILKAIMEEPYTNFKYSILTTNSPDAKEMATLLITKFDTINKGYNLDTSMIKAFYSK